MTCRISQLRPTWSLVLSIIFLLAFAPTTVSGQGQTLNLSLNHAGYERNYILYVPSGQTPSNSAPLVFNLHGGGRTAQEQLDWTDMSFVAEREGFLTAYPQAYGGYWWGPSGNDPYDDAGFFDAMIADISSQYSVDSSRTYVTGLSHGALMTYILTAARPYTFAAAAPVAADRPYAPGTTDCAPLDLPATPGRPFPLLHIHGTADQAIPYYGGPFAGWMFPPVEQVVGEYAINNGADTTPTVVDLPNISTTDNSTVQVLTYGNPDSYLDVDGSTREAETVLYRIVGGGHNWPDMIPPERNPPVNRDINANELIWDFFSRHVVAAKPLPGDYNSDSVVDALDYETWKAAFGSTLGLYAGADGNGNGIVDAADFTVWRDNLGAVAETPINDAATGVMSQSQHDSWKANYGTPVPPSKGSAAIPEPETFVLLVAILLAPWLKRSAWRIQSTH